MNNPLLLRRRLMMQQQEKPFAIKGDGTAFIRIPAFNMNASNAPEITYYWDGGFCHTQSQKTNTPGLSIFSTQQTNFIYKNLMTGNSMFERYFRVCDRYWSVPPNVLRTDKALYGYGVNTGNTMLCNNELCICKIKIGTLYELIPWVKSGEVGLKDTINDVFYGNVAGAGYFTAIMDPLNSMGGGKYLKINKIHKCSLVERRAA